MQEESIELNIIHSIISGEVVTADDLSSKFKMPIIQAVKILNDPIFLSALGNFTKAKANIAFHTKGISRLIGMLNDEDNDTVLRAIKTLAQYTGNIESKGNEVNVNLNLESVITGMEKQIGSNQKQLPESKIIDIVPSSVLDDFDFIGS